MPVGILIDSLAIIVGGTIGTILGPSLSDGLKSSLRQCFGFMATAIGISLIPSVKNLGAVALALIIGTVLGTLVDLDGKTMKVSSALDNKINKGKGDASLFSSVFVLFTFSATNIIGALTESVSGDSSIILCKAVLDLFTAAIFASELGKTVAFLFIPQLIVGLLCFFIGKPAMNLLVGETLGDFKALGGIVMLMVGLKLLNITKTKPVDAVPSIVLAIPISMLWQMVF
ncbi:MAG: DUF554 family protein [Candidatus Ornithospirochaeta sp.]